MSERHPNVRCMTTWCRYWHGILDESTRELIGGCGTWDLLIATTSGEDAPTCVAYRVSDNPLKAGIHGSEQTPKETEV